MKRVLGLCMVTFFVVVLSACELSSTQEMTVVSIDETSYTVKLTSHKLHMILSLSEDDRVFFNYGETPGTNGNTMNVEITDFIPLELNESILDLQIGSESRLYFLTDFGRIIQLAISGDNYSTFTASTEDLNVRIFDDYEFTDMLVEWDSITTVTENYEVIVYSEAALDSDFETKTYVLNEGPVVTDITSYFDGVDVADLISFMYGVIVVDTSDQFHFISYVNTDIDTLPECISKTVGSTVSYTTLNNLPNIPLEKQKELFYNSNNFTFVEDNEVKQYNVMGDNVSDLITNDNWLIDSGTSVEFQSMALYYSLYLTSNKVLAWKDDSYIDLAQYVPLHPGETFVSMEEYYFAQINRTFRVVLLTSEGRVFVSPMYNGEDDLTQMENGSDYQELNTILSLDTNEVIHSMSSILGHQIKLITSKGTIVSFLENDAIGDLDVFVEGAPYETDVHTFEYNDSSEILSEIDSIYGTYEGLYIDVTCTTPYDPDTHSDVDILFVKID